MAAQFRPQRGAVAGHGTDAIAAGQLQACVDIGPAALAGYAGFASSVFSGPAQSAGWIEAWVEATRPDFFVASLKEGGRTVFSLPLEVTRAGPLSIARFPAGNHANGNFAPVSPQWAARAGAADLAPLFAAIRQARPDLDLICLDRMAAEIEGVKNPLMRLARRPTPNPALSLSLEGGFEGVLERASGKRKSKKHRSQARKFDAAGGYRRIEARTAEEAGRLLDAFFAMKADRLRKMGIANVFASAEIQAFFRALFGSAIGKEKPGFVLHGLEVGGRIRAVTGSSICGGRIVCEFGAISDDELAASSPGEFLFFENIAEACEKGFSVYDFSVGDEPYKRQWCNIAQTQWEAFVPLSLGGRALAGLLWAKAEAKRRIKANPWLWATFKRLRRARAAGAVPADDQATERPGTGGGAS